MPWYEYESTSSSPSKDNITPPAGQYARFDVDGGTGLQLRSVDGWISVTQNEEGIFKPTRAQIQSMNLVNNRYRFKIEKSSQPTTENVKVYNFTTKIYENSYFAVS